MCNSNNEEIENKNNYINIIKYYYDNKCLRINNLYII